MFSTDAWARNTAVYERIRTMPFNQNLADGTLPLKLFRHYIIQDAHYLVAFAQALAIASAKADHPDHVVQFAQGAAGAIAVERELHTGYFRTFGVTPDEVASTPVSPAAHHYISFLIATGFREPLAVHLAALLPCFWVYREVGRDILGRASIDNPYRAWIDAYGGEDFSTAVDAMIATTDALAAEAGAPIVAAMHAAFTRATQLEWMFWDSAYRDAGWPV
ncbi:thiaminase II [Lichenihabitans sp. PAMC28606]|uniref:thiaminase II n=1 Tax=Lichenihabitans sp. PAMC28606 TaxID=2880932 RepID=UPI001D0B5481|nr:thiaminase II [Lichenihabitans sp. PAMC28606]UDL94884.1 thiaminase II [Lichenihabitans sp. PAMC28606]